MPGRRLRALALLVWTASAAPAALAQEPAPAPDTRPTVAVMYFSNGTIFRRADYEPLTRGLADMLITGLTGNDRIRVLERAQLQRILEEGTLGASYRVDQETAVRLGRILGAHHMIFGSFLIEDGDRMRIVARAVNVETSEVEHVETITDRTSRVLDVVNELAVRLNRGMRLPPMPARQQGAAAPRPRAERWYVLYSRALVEEDRHDVAAAVALYRQVLDDFPGYEPAQRALRRLASAP